MWTGRPYDRGMPPAPGRDIWLRRAWLATWLLLIATWLAHVGGHAPPPAWSRGVAILAVLATLALTAVLLRRRWHHDATATGLGLAVLTLAFAFAFAGLDHEIGDRTWLDEGTYAHHASEINAGEWVRDSFVYPHALYYLGAFAIWLVSLAADPVLVAAREWLGIADWSTVCRLVLRIVVAGIGASTVVPVMQLASRLAPPPLDRRLAGLTAGLALAVCVPWIEGSHLAICDIPSAAAAAWCLAACARWLDHPGVRPWVEAGLWSGLAAAAKYPAGLVAVGIIAVAAADAVRRPRRGLLGLLVAGLASLTIFVATNPSLLVLPEMALYGDRGILFGAIQYAGEGWLGVVPDNRLVYYGGIVVEGFGLALAATLGLGFLPRGSRRNALVLLAFPLAFAILLGSMTVAVERNVYPLLAPVATALGLGLAATFARLRLQSRRVLLGGPLLLLAWPLWNASQLAQGYRNPSTREEARAWMVGNLAPGLVVLREDYAPQFPTQSFATVRLRSRFAGALPLTSLGERSVDVVVLAAPAWGRFFAEGATLSPHDAAIRAGYDALFANLEPIARFEPQRRRRGPRLDVYLVPASLREPRSSLELGAPGWFIPDGTMLAQNHLRFAKPGQWATASVALETGTFELVVVGTGLDTSEISVTDRRQHELARGSGPTLRVHLERPDVVVVTVRPQLGATIAQLTVSPTTP